MRIMTTTALAAIMATGALAQTAKPPVAPTRPYTVKSPNGDRADEYYWLRDDTRKNPEMLAYLKAENDYADTVLKPLEPLDKTLYDGIVSHIKQDDSSVPYRKAGYYYGTRFASGANYPVSFRRKDTADGPEEILFDQPAMATGKAFFQIGDSAVSPDNRSVAWAEDLVGRRQYVLKVKDIATGKQVAETIANIEPNVVWADDNKTVLYVAKDPVTLRGSKVMAHVVGTPASADRLVYEEKDDTFNMGIGRTSDDKFVCVVVGTTVSDEQRCAPAGDLSTFTLVAPRAREFKYDADHIGDRWVIRTNRDALNYKLATVGDGDWRKGPAAWRDLVPASKTVFIEGFKPFDGFIAIDERANANRQIRLLTNAGKSIPVRADEPAYTMGLSTNAETTTPWVRYTYGSLVTPTTTTKSTPGPASAAR